MKKNVKRIVVAIVLSVITLFAFVSCSKAKTTLGGVKTGYANTLKSAKTVTQTMDYYDGKVKIRSRKSVSTSTKTCFSNIPSIAETSKALSSATTQ